MRLTTLSVLAVVVLLPCTANRSRAGPEREARTGVHWGGTLPKEVRELKPGTVRPKPVLVYVPARYRSQDQERFEEVVLNVEQFALCTRFFTCVEIAETDAGVHPLLEGLRLRPPVIVVFDSTLRKHAVVRSRASAMKAYGAMRSIGQPDYHTSFKKTLQKAKALLGAFDQVDDARKVLGLKKARMETARARREMAKVRKLEQEVERDQGQIDKLHAETERKWQEVWQLKRRKVKQ